MTKPRLVLCSGAQEQDAGQSGQGRHVISLDSLGSRQNVNITVENVTDAFARNLSDRLVDLLEIASYVYAADCTTDRGGEWADDDSTEPWDRDFRFVIPVRERGFWSRSDVNSALVEALEFVSADRYQFDFHQLTRERDKIHYLDLGGSESTPFVGVERVQMFSGGLDSLAGAVDAVSNGESLVLVSHRPVHQINRRQLDLCAAIRKKYNAPILHVPVWINKDKRLTHEFTQRTRSFLYSAIGAAVAGPLNAGGVRFCENGVVSLNLPVLDEAQRARASRTTHPKALQLFGRLYQMLMEREFIVDNPYIFSTRTELVSLVAEKQASDLIKLSCSCSHTMRKCPGKPHCGLCGQCLDRRIAILAAGQEAYDPADGYAYDFITGSRHDSYERKIAVGYAGLAWQLNRMSADQIVGRYNKELSRAAFPFPHRAEAGQQFVDMLKRHAQTVVAVLEQQVGRHGGEFFTRELDETSLLAALGRGEHTPTGPQLILDYEPTPTEVGNLFRRDNRVWIIRYQQSELRPFPDTHGMSYIHYLLENPNTPIRVDKLYAAIHGAPSVDENGLLRLPQAQELLNECPSTEDVGRVHGDREWSVSAEYKKGWEDLQEEEQRALRRDDATDLADVRKRKADYLRFLSSEFGKRGKRRTATDPYKRPRQTVRATYKLALKTISLVLPDLGEHLEQSIRVGTECCYIPTPETSWTT